VSLAESSRSYAGQLLCFEPWRGWGWFQLDMSGEKVPIDYDAVDQAGSFHIRVHRFFAADGELRGIIGRVEQPRHLFDGMWAATWTMLVGDFDLTNNLCWRWDMDLSPVEPSGDEWPTEPVAPPAYFGTGGVLAVSQGVIATWRAAFDAGPPA
jgi:hypothetical protein